MSPARTPERSVIVYEDRRRLAAGVADRFFDVIGELLAGGPVAHVVLTGGTVGAEVLAALGASPRAAAVDWSRIEFWWGDERWLPAGDPERNDTLADAGLLRRLADAGAVDQGRIHRMPASDGPLDLDGAAEHYAAELARHAPEGAAVPRFDLVFLGVGPDGHIASLFPDRDGVRAVDPTVIPVRESPKPPPERLSLTLPVLNSADRVWLCLAGDDKAAALGLALAGASPVEVPAAGVTGRLQTVFFVDRRAAADVPPDLLAEDGPA